MTEPHEGDMQEGSRNHSLLIRNAKVPGAHSLTDVAIVNGKITEMQPRLDLVGKQEIDLDGRLLLPGLVDAHLHLDKCLLGRSMRQNRSGSIAESIQITWNHKRQYRMEEIVSRANEVVEQAILHGTTAIRAFADVDTIGRTTGIRALLELRERRASEIDIQVVAYPQEGILRDAGCKEMMQEAMSLGADVVGGAPYYELTDSDMHDHVDFCFSLAQEYDKDIHMLVDDTDDPLSRSLEYLAVRTKEEGYEGRVIAGHCGSLASYDHAHAEIVIGLVAEAEITICSNPHISLVLMGAHDRGLVRRGITRVTELLEAGVNVIAAQDDVDDPFYPFGKPDLLEIAQYMAHVARLTNPDGLSLVIDMVTGNAAKALRLPSYGLQPGARADMVAIDAPSIKEALRLLPPRTAVIRGGEVVAESRLDERRHRSVQPRDKGEADVD